MSKDTDKSLFIFSPVLSEYAGLYQEMLSGLLGFQRLGNRLIQLAEQAHAFRLFDKVKELGQLLSNIPIKSYQAIGHYFLAVAANSMGNGDQDKAKRLFELAVDTAPDAYKVKSVLSLGALAFNKMDFDSALCFYQETIKAGKLSIASLHAIKAISVLKSIEGSHTHAIKDIESVLPLIKYAPPHIHFDILNSYAVELSEVGRTDEAEKVSRITIASSFAPYYPEWQATYSEIRSTRKRRFAIVVSRPQYKAERQPPNQQALEIYEPDIEPDTNLLPFRKRDPLNPQPHLYSHIETTGNQYTTNQKRSLIIDIASNLKEETLDRLFAFAMELDEPQARRRRQIDLEDKGTLEMLMNLWTSGDLDIGDHVAVLSALRDCDDNLRFKNIINEMITYMFRFTQERMQSESFWRKRFEAELIPKDD